MIATLRKLPRLHLYVGQFILSLLLLQGLLRVVFFFKFNPTNNPIPLGDLSWAFYLGLKYDLQFALILSLPIFLLGWISYIHPICSTAGRRLWSSYIVFMLLCLLLFHAANFGYYAYLEQNIDATALRFLETPLISATMVWQTYPVIWAMLIFSAIGWGYYRLMQTVNARIDASRTLNVKWKGKTGIVIVTFFVVLFGLFGKISWYPLRWSDAFFSSTHTFTSYLASNPVMYFYNTLKNSVETYDLEAAKKYYPLMAEYLGVDYPDPEKLDYTRTVTFEDNGSQKPNIIIVILESFASYKTGLSGNPLNPTPHFDQIAKDGAYFNNHFVPHTGTARSVWALITGLPDIEKNRTSSRNPLIVKQHTIINDLEGYDKSYFLGGSASWANIRGLLSSNIKDLAIYEEGSYESERIDVWGISDLSLFREAHAVLKEKQGPFFAIIQTSGNHRPYTIPEDNDGFIEISEKDTEHKPSDYGFMHFEELNSFRFMDHSIGRFMEMARKEGYFDNTLFVFFGDHGITNRTGKHTPQSEDILQVSSHRVPLVFYGPGVLKQTGIIEKVASEVDVLPTVASLTRNSYTNTTLGRDLFDTTFDKMRYAYTIIHGSFRTIGLLTDQYFQQMRFDGSDAHLHQLGTDTPNKDLTEEKPELNKTMMTYTSAINATTRYIRENNQPKQ
ncbi:MAG: LTA synthase family protein [Gammaproteobacteria bacterium]|nr:LTA synthase family protein [Gammaproteobacteria bacterium]